MRLSDRFGAVLLIGTEALSLCRQKWNRESQGYGGIGDVIARTRAVVHNGESLSTVPPTVWKFVTQLVTQMQNTAHNDMEWSGRQINKYQYVRVLCRIEHYGMT